MYEIDNQSLGDLAAEERKRLHTEGTGRKTVFFQ